MPKRAISLRGTAMAAIAGAALSLPLTTIGHAQQGATGTPAAGMPLKTHHPRVVHRRLYNRANPNMQDPAAPRMEKPLPQASRHYHGSNGP
jgi:hypothetical protein